MEEQIHKETYWYKSPTGHLARGNDDRDTGEGLLKF